MLGLQGGTRFAQRRIEVSLRPIAIARSSTPLDGPRTTRTLPIRRLRERRLGAPAPWTQVPFAVRALRVGATAARGFTLIELMVVVVIIGVMVTLAVPSVARQMRDRRNNIAAHDVSLLYRTARARSVGRGAAVLVRFSQATRGRVEMFEAINSVGGKNGSNGALALLPATSCQNTDWNAAAADQVSRAITHFDPAELNLYDNVAMKFYDAAGTARSVADICFSPLGRPFIRYTTTGTFSTMAEVPHVTLTPVDGIGLTRTVLVLPDGASRLTL